MKKFNKKGFTIVELVIVIAIIAILAAVLIPTFSSVIDSAKESAALQEANAALTSYTAAMGKDYDASKLEGILVESNNKVYLFSYSTSTGLSDKGTVQKKGSTDKDAAEIADVTIEDTKELIKKDTTSVAGKSFTDMSGNVAIIVTKETTT